MKAVTGEEASLGMGRCDKEGRIIEYIDFTNRESDEKSDENSDEKGEGK